MSETVPLSTSKPIRYLEICLIQAATKLVHQGQRLPSSLLLL